MDEKEFLESVENFKKIFKAGLIGVGIVASLIVIFNSVYILENKEQAVITRFGAYHETTTQPGLNFKLPFIDRRYIADVSSINRLELGVLTTQNGSKGVPGESVTVEEEALMLTGDENLVLVETVVQYQITNFKDYLFNVENPTSTLRVIADSVVHRVVATHTLDEILTDNKLVMQDEMKAELQELVDEYGLGISIRNIQFQDVNPPQEVETAFRDVSGAKEDKNTSINEGTAYANKKLPEAEGKAKSLINEADAYYEERTKEAQGNVAEFVKLYEEYIKGRDVTRTRLYYEVMQEVLPNINKVITSNSGNMLQFLPIEQSLNNNQKSTPNTESTKTPEVETKVEGDGQ